MYDYHWETENRGDKVPQGDRVAEVGDFSLVIDFFPELRLQTSPTARSAHYGRRNGSL